MAANASHQSQENTDNGQRAAAQPAAVGQLRQAASPSADAQRAEPGNLGDIANGSPRAAQFKALAQLVRQSPQARQQRTLAQEIDNSPRMAAQRKTTGAMHDAAIQRQTAEAAQAAQKPNRTGLPDRLKSGVESLSGMSMDHVKVHYNSPQPAQLNAHAYAQGSDIHVAPGQEKHLPHEAWHVVQQAQGRVVPTMQMKGGVAVNDDGALEHEADIMGAKAIASDAAMSDLSTTHEDRNPAGGNSTAQLALATYDDDILEESAYRRWTHLHTEADGKAGDDGTAEGRGAHAEESGTEWTTTVNWGGVNKNGDGKWMEANPLGPDHTLGTAPASDPKDKQHQWNKNRRDQQIHAGGEKYIAGHLLNAKLGGMGDDARNLAAIPDEANKKHYQNVEKKIEKLVNKQHAWVYYKVETKQKNDSIKKVPYTSAFICDWHQLASDGTKVRGTHGNARIVIPEPSSFSTYKAKSKAKPKAKKKAPESTVTPSGKGFETTKRHNLTEWTKVSRKHVVLKDTNTLSAQKLVMGPINELLTTMGISETILEVDEAELRDNYFAIVEAIEMNSEEKEAYEEIASALEKSKKRRYKPRTRTVTALENAPKERKERYEKIESAVKILYDQLHEKGNAEELMEGVKKAWEKEDLPRRNTEELCANVITRFKESHSKSKTLLLELDEIKSESSVHQSKLEDTQSKLENTQYELEDTQHQLEDARSEIEKLRAEIEKLRSKSQEKKLVGVGQNPKRRRPRRNNKTNSAPEQNFEKKRKFDENSNEQRQKNTKTNSTPGGNSWKKVKRDKQEQNNDETISTSRRNFGGNAKSEENRYEQRNNSWIRREGNKFTNSQSHFY
jgi:hypothetical protein